MYAVPEAVADDVIRAAQEGRIVQNTWRKRASDGRELVCALAAFGPNINAASDCPADYMPEWLAQLVPTLDDGIAADKVAPFAIGLAERSKRWSVLDDAAWSRVSNGFLSACITSALESAAAVQPTPAPAYWDQVQDACGAVLAALKSGEGLAQAAYAAARAADAAYADAAYAAADAARAARAAARAARAAAAYAAADADADADADAAADAAFAAYADAAFAAYAAADAAADAARAAAYWNMVEGLFAAIDAELAA